MHWARLFPAITTLLTVAAACLLLAGPAAAKGGGGFVVRPGFIPYWTYLDVPHGPPVSVAIGGRGVGYLAPMLRMGGEGFYDFRAEIGTGGFLADLVIPLGAAEIDIGGVVGGGTYGLFLEPGVGLQIGKGPFAFEVRLSYQWHPIQMPNDNTRYHRGLTYLSFAFMFGKF